ncbi:hotdog fold thioesterase [Myxococcota bacterium]|nr:hotdog fold thioesterase [Myxococcota bacterium]MBU1430369.1 hotdog fold thioesterase [Myxococcota bacterium]MBU1898361.1 hotdog fold thioesterase [Myxococcota bacterium]
MSEALSKLKYFWEQASPFQRLLGVEVVALEPGRAVLRVPLTPQLWGDPKRQALHGGVTATIIDSAGGLACFSQFTSAQQRAATIDLRTDYLLPVLGEGALCCEGVVVRMGGRVAVSRMRAWVEGDEAHTVATGTGVYHVIRGGER